MQNRFKRGVGMDNACAGVNTTYTQSWPDWLEQQVLNHKQFRKSESLRPLEAFKDLRSHSDECPSEPDQRTEQFHPDNLACSDQ